MAIRDYFAVKRILDNKYEDELCSFCSKPAIVLIRGQRNASCCGCGNGINACLDCLQKIKQEIDNVVQK